MSLDELQHLNERPIRVRVFGWIDHTTGCQIVEFRVRYEAQVYACSYFFPPYAADIGPLAQLSGVRRAWRKLREGLRKRMHGDNFRERWRIERMKRTQLDTWEKYQAPFIEWRRRHYARENFIANLERLVGPTPPYTGHDYTRRVVNEHRDAVRNGTY